MGLATAEVSAKLASLKAPVFLARSESRAGKTVLTLHSGEPALSSQLAAVAQKELGSDKIAVRVRRHAMRDLLRPKSLEDLGRRFGEGEIVYDPTRIVTRAALLVSLARSIRRALPAKVKAIGFETRRRTLYVILDGRTQDRSTQSLRETMAASARVVERWRNESRPDFDLSVRVGFDAPPASRLVAVDSRSVMTGLSTILTAKLARVARIFGVAALFGAGTAVAAHAADAGSPGREPAVSQPNLTIIKKGGVTDGDFRGELYAKGAVPIGDAFGAQLEAGIGLDDYYGVAGHLFTRDPGFGLLGAYASYEADDNIDISRIAAEAELYLNAITLGGDIGYQGGDVEHGVFGRVDLKFYASPDFVLSIGGETSPGIDFGRISAEWRPGFEALPGLSLFADGEFGNHDYESVRIGFTYHFGSSSSSLLDRDRREDPGLKLRNEGPVQAEKEKRKKDSGYTPPVSD